MSSFSSARSLPGTLTRCPKALLIDLAGVLHVGDQALPGAVAALAQLRQCGLPLRFLTNTTRTPGPVLLARLRALGFAIAPHELQTAVDAARHWVAQRGLRPYYLVHPAIADEVGPSDPEPNGVVIGDAGPCFSYEALNRAFRLIMAGLPWVAMARNRYFQEADGLSLDMGAFVAGLEYSTGTRAEVVGKPAPAFFATALESLGVAPADALLVGDDLSDDIGGGQRAGIPAVLVRTGKYRPADEAHPELKADAVVDDFAALVAALLPALQAGG